MRRRTRPGVKRRSRPQRGRHAVAEALASSRAYPPPGAVAYLPLTGVGVEPVPPAPVPAASPGALMAMALALSGAAAVALKRMAR